MLDDRELATVLAALRTWQKEVIDDPDMPQWIRKSMTWGPFFADHKPLDAAEIDALCDRLNGGGYDGSECPNCRSGSIGGDPIEASGCDKAHRNCLCNVCEATWTEEFRLVGYSELEGVSNPNP